ncbi:hypothetical protein HIM_06092 [Hirsutella minnesotensis 3608]|uniref:C2H2-type domain-containing protein n=1 Tax=Hirsutella minnesotensis 3608 TaxID=1043627 RepID=A0A0F7ZJK5_9HYPO|nr:hypothetical protein HIM_06092 [Hirsutella minnesotensis 3608]
MASQQTTASVSARDAGYKRASRKGAPRRFACDHPGCDKIYSRAEHLQRHQLNHNPKEIFQCDVGGCDQKFVRLDLLARHKKRHTAAYTPRNRIPSFDISYDSTTPSRVFQYTPRFHPPLYPQSASTALHGKSIPTTPGSGRGQSFATSTPFYTGPRTNEKAWSSSMEGGAAQDRRGVPMLGDERGVYGDHIAASYNICTPAADIRSTLSADEQLGSGRFTAWLFDPRTTSDDLNMASFPFLEGGLDSAFGNLMQYDTESLQKSSPIDQNSRGSDLSGLWLTEARRQEILRWFRVFRAKQPTYESSMAHLIFEMNGDLPAVSLEMLHDCLGEFWDNISSRMPVVHQNTFAAQTCPIFLLLVMIALGAASLHSRDTTDRFTEFGTFGDAIIDSIRWEILTSDDATPPISLWVAQALLLLEFYEKMYSSRRFHERAHVYHSVFLTLLRRGSPLIGRTGSETPQEHVDQCSNRNAPNTMLTSTGWWRRWAERESMHRVVYSAFMLDIVHAAMFGHTADMAAHEIRLLLPCDDDQWNAASPETVRQLEGHCERISFLDGLKSVLHGKGIKMSPFGRMAITAGLLSVGWHMARKETQHKWLEIRITPAETQDSWRGVLAKALGKWKQRVDAATSAPSKQAAGPRTPSNGPIESPHVLFHLVHISLHTDIIDCQVYARAERLLGRKVATMDYDNAVRRMNAWAEQASSRHAVLHAFKLLHHVLVQPRHRKRGGARFAESPMVHYSIRDEMDPHRPWIMYYAVLTIWAFVQAVGRPPGEGFPLRPSQVGHSTYARMAEYLSWVAGMSELREADAATLYEGLPELLDVVEGILEEAETELLQEARERLGVCRDMLMGGCTRS